MKPRMYDISPRVSPRTAVFPGDRPFQRTVSLAFEKGDHLALSSMETTLHVGAHADAPGHYLKGGVGISDRDPRLYLGGAQVIHVRLPRSQRIRVKDIQGKKILASRVLFRTDSFPDPDLWNGDFNSLSAELVEHLVASGVKLVGIDTPSVDPAEDQKLESHQAIARADLAILEGLVLDEVDEGIYTLLAAPLKLEGADASPVRALLFSDPEREGARWLSQY